jgi:hypothetical protein
MKVHAYRSASILALTASFAEGRNYLSVIDHDIYQRSNIDTDRYQLKIEMDPFFYPGAEKESEAPLEPTQAPYSQVWITPSPTENPSSIPSDFPSLAPTAPTPAPSKREENTDGNGGCLAGTTLYQVNMYDAWGDGWDGTMLQITGIEDQNPTDISGNTVTTSVTTETDGMTVTISKRVELNSGQILNKQEFKATPVEPLGTVFQGGLLQGSHSAADVCLMPRRCYQVLVSGGDFLDEVSWDIRAVQLGSAEQDSAPLLDGDAPADCTLSVPDENGTTFCPATCSTTMNPEITEVPRVVDTLQVNEADHGDAVGSSTVGQESYETTLASTRGTTLLTYLQRGHGNRKE